MSTCAGTSASSESHSQQICVCMFSTCSADEKQQRLVGGLGPHPSAPPEGVNPANLLLQI